MSQHRSLIRATLIVAAVALVATAALPASAAAATPNDRYDQWVGSLQTLLDTRSDLSRAEVDALWEGIRQVDARMFADDAGKARREALTRQADALATGLSCKTYSQALSGFGELKRWLEVTEVIAAPADCNCGDSGCATGFTCKSVNCTSPAGTTHWGRCDKTAVSVEPVPRHPVGTIEN